MINLGIAKLLVLLYFIYEKSSLISYDITNIGNNNIEKLNTG
jgi:hypothetical protein